MREGGTLVRARTVGLDGDPGGSAEEICRMPGWLREVATRNEDGSCVGAPVALLAPFGGSGLGRLAMDEMLDTLGGRLQLVESAFAELDGHLADAVERLWGEVHRVTGRPRHRRLCGDVWGLLRGSVPALKRWVDVLPGGCLVLVVTGTPCRQLTKAGGDFGVLGLCGTDSVLFYVVPVIVGKMQEWRPDIYVHVGCLENAGGTLDVHKNAMLWALGGLECEGGLYRRSTRRWSHAPRDRIYLSTMPLRPVGAEPKRRREPWEGGFSARRDWEAVPFMTARGGPNEMMASTYQYHPARCLYAGDWHGLSMAQVVERMHGYLDDRQRVGFDLVRQGAPRPREEEALVYARWVEEAGARVGVRVATVAERVRSTGREGYLLALGLSPRQLFDVVGNHFDPDAVILRMYGALREWADGARYRCSVPDPAALLREYGRVHAWVVRQQEQQWLAGGEGGAGARRTPRALRARGGSCGALRLGATPVTLVGV